MMISTALSTMIDKTECLIFLNTPNSITPNDEIDKILSPWIYSEIAMSRLIRKKEVSERRESQRRRIMFSKSLNEDTTPNLEVKYDVDLSHLTKININGLNIRVKLKPFNEAYEALDTFYDLNHLQTTV